MEDTHRVERFDYMKEWGFSLNPCSNGRYSQSNEVRKDTCFEQS